MESDISILLSESISTNGLSECFSSFPTEIQMENHSVAFGHYP